MPPRPATDPVRYAVVGSPIGDLLLTGDGTVLTRLYMDRPRWERGLRGDWVRDDDAFAEARRQLAAYFGGELLDFDLPLAAGGTPFQARVWAALREIPFGATESYGALARRIGHPDAVRAVGAANGQNPISIVVPCHRVVGANGSLTGYGGGLERKRWLLAHESRVRPRFMTMENG